MLKYALFFVSAAGISFLITPLIERLAHKYKILDMPSERKIHKSPVPLLGGISIFIGFNAAIFLGFLLHNEYLANFVRTKWIPILIPEIIILFIGVYDDIKKVRAFQKFLFQVMAGSLVVIFGFGIHIIKNPFTGNIMDLGGWSIPVTILWVVGITNALNLIDGLDGLAAGISFIVCFAVFGIAYIYQNVDIALVSLTLAGSILGFLKYNFHPARIFLGDSGSLLLGFLLSVLSIEGAHKGAIIIAVLAPLLVLGLPIMDTVLSMIRRILRPIRFGEPANGRRPGLKSILRKLSIFTADDDHIHHRLLKLGFSQRKAVVLLYGVCLLLCALAFLTVAKQNINITIFLVAILIASVIGIQSLKYQEFRVFHHGRFLNLLDWPLIGKTYFQVFIDLLFIFLSYYLSTLIIRGGFEYLAVKNAFIETFPLVLIVKIAVFYLAGLYKGTWRYTGITDLVKIIKAMILSSGTMYLALALLAKHGTLPGGLFFVLDFYFLLTFVGGFRIASRGFDYYYRNKNLEGAKILIYGAGRRGGLLVKEFPNLSSSRSQIVGFIDDDPAKNEEAQTGIPVLGSFENLAAIIQAHSVTEIIVTSEDILKNKQIPLKNICTEHSLKLKLFEINLRPIK